MDTSLGGAGTIANLFGELLKVNGFDRTGASAAYDTDFNIADGITYFRTNFQPANESLRGTGEGGVDIGAVDLAAAGSSSTQGLRQAAFRTAGSSSGTYNEDILEATKAHLVDDTGTQNEQLTKYLQSKLSSTNPNLPGLMSEAAADRSKERWTDLGSDVTSVGS